MRRSLLSLLLGLWASFGAHATTLVNLGTHNQASASTNVLTTVTNSCAAGSTVVLGASYVTLADTLSSVVDSAGNTWATPFDNITGTGVGQGIAYAPNITSQLAVGATITATFAGSTSTSLVATCVRNMVGTILTDTTNQTSQGLAATSATTVNTGTLATSADVVFGFLSGPTSQGTTTCGGSFTKVSLIATPSITACFQVASSTSSIPFSPTWTNTINYVSDVVSFKGSSSCWMGTLGVGTC